MKTHDWHFTTFSIFEGNRETTRSLIVPLESIAVARGYALRMLHTDTWRTHTLAYKYVPRGKYSFELHSTSPNTAKLVIRAVRLVDPTE